MNPHRPAHLIGGAETRPPDVPGSILCGAVGIDSGWVQSAKGTAPTCVDYNDGLYSILPVLIDSVTVARACPRQAAKFSGVAVCTTLRVNDSARYKEIPVSKILTEVLESNHKYAADFGVKGKLALPPARSFAILTCMDARLDPAKFAGLVEGDAHVIRNAGGRASDDAIRSLVISYKLLGTREFFVIHHTDCGMEFFSNDVMRDLLASSLETAQLTSTGFRDVGAGPGSRAGEYIEWLTIRDRAQAVVDDVDRIRNHPLVPKSIPIYGFVYDVRSGKLIEVSQATIAGKAA